MAPPLSVVHVSAPAPFGGLESVVAALSRGQRARGIDASVVAVLEPEDRPTGHPFLELLRSSGVPARTLRVPSRAYLRERRALRRLLQEVGPDVVHTHGFRPDVVDAGVARAAGIPVVSTVHGFTGAGARVRLYEAIQLRCLRRHDAVVAVSGPLARRLEAAGVPSDRVFVHPNAWVPEGERAGRDEAADRLGLDPGAFHLGWVGRLSHEKGPDVFLEALGTLRDLEWTASFVGDGPLRQRLEERARELGIAGRVVWHGWVPEAGRRLAAFDVLVNSSRTEGTPIVLLEAMAAARPVVAARVGGVGELVREAGRLVPPDDPAALAEAVRALATDVEAARALGSEGRRRVEEWGDPVRWVEGYRAVYARAAGVDDPEGAKEEGA